MNFKNALLIISLAIYLPNTFAQKDMKNFCPLENGKIQKLMSENKYSLSEPSGGIKILADTNLEVYSIMKGMVIKLDTIGINNPFILIKQGEYIISYSQLEETYVNNGELVKRGQRIGKLYSSGGNKKSLYVEVWDSINKINPLDFIDCYQ